MRLASRIKILPILSHPAFLAVPVFLLIFLLIDIRIREYQIQTDALENENYSMEKTVFSDIDSDGSREKIRVYNLKTNATVIALTTNNTFVEAWNFPGYWYDSPEFIIEDYNGDGTEEMYALTINNGDSIMVHQLVLKQNQKILRSKFVCQIKKFNGLPDHEMILLGFCEINGDDQKDLLLRVNAGFSLEPRATYAWDLKKDSIFRSPPHGLNSKRTDQLVYTYDSAVHKRMLFISTVATDNCKDPVLFPDTASYAVVYTLGLNYLFEPIPLGGPQSRTSTYPFIYQGQNYILAICFEQRRISEKTEIILIGADGAVHMRKRTDLFDYEGINSNFWFNGRVMAVQTDFTGNKTHFGSINENLDFEPEAALTGFYDHFLSANIDQDPDFELILINHGNQHLIIMQDDMKFIAETEIPVSEFAYGYITLKDNSNGDAKLYVQSSQFSYELQMKKNRLYPFRWLIYLLFYLTFTLALYLLRFLFTYSNRQRAEREKTLMKYQLQTILNQLNPHFTFNAINSIGDAVLEGRNEEAYEYFTKLSNLIRKSMTHAIEPYKSLGEEIEFVREYLEIERYRFGERLEWSLEIDPHVNQDIPVPKMLIHIFVENALKHGIFHLKTTGIIKINIHRQKNGTEITIQDNGVGMDKAYEIEGQKGKGIDILNRYLNIYNSSFPHPISYTIQTSSEDMDSGTEVVIRIGSTSKAEKIQK